MEPDNSCECERCKAACENRPGWFLPGEAELAAKLKGMTLQDFFNKYLSVDFYYGEDEKPIFVLAPATDTSEPGKEYPMEPCGRCILFTDDGKCSIHIDKPYECRKMHHDGSAEAGDITHEEVSKAWEKHQDQIKELLGRDPEPPDMGDVLIWGLSALLGE